MNASIVRLGTALLAAFFLFSGAAVALEVKAGDVVILVERDIHIPAHPDAGDPSVPFRFVSGSKGDVLAVDPTTGWIELKGTSTFGSEKTGWITKKYIESVDEDHGDDDGSNLTEPQLGWPPQKGSTTPRHPNRLRIATWNIENLHAESGQSTYTGSDPSVKRQDDDYERIRNYIRMFDPDGLAVQEVDGEEALKRVIDTDVKTSIAMRHALR